MEHLILRTAWSQDVNGRMLGPASISLGAVHSNLSYSDIQQIGIIVRALYAEYHVELHATSGLRTLCVEADALAAAWNVGAIESQTNDRLFRVAHFRRVAESVAELRHAPDPTPYLRRLKQGSLDPYDREESDAKNILWEIELWRLLRQRGVDAELIEPPDIAATFPSGRLVVACKRLYSEANVAKVLSNAVGQIKSSASLGIVALCLDDLLPPGHILTAPTFATALDVLSTRNRRVSIGMRHRAERNYSAIEVGCFV